MMMMMMMMMMIMMMMMCRWEGGDIPKGGRAGRASSLGIWTRGAKSRVGEIPGTPVFVCLIYFRPYLLNFLIKIHNVDYNWHVTNISSPLPIFQFTFLNSLYPMFYWHS